MGDTGAGVSSSARAATRLGVDAFLAAVAFLAGRFVGAAVAGGASVVAGSAGFRSGPSAGVAFPARDSRAAGSASGGGISLATGLPFVEPGCFEPDGSLEAVGSCSAAGGWKSTAGAAFAARVHESSRWSGVWGRRGGVNVASVWRDLGVGCSRLPRAGAGLSRLPCCGSVGDCSSISRQPSGIGGCSPLGNAGWPGTGQGRRQEPDEPANAGRAAIGSGRPPPVDRSYVTAGVPVPHDRLPAGSRFAPRRYGPVFSIGGGLRATWETSPSLVYGAALLMRLGS